MCFSIPVIALAVNGLFSRYMADDFATAFTLRTQGFWNMQHYWYTSWSGRFAFFFVVGIIETLGSWIVPVLPMGALVALIAGFFLIFLQPLLFVGVQNAAPAALSLSLLIVFTAFTQTPNVVQSLYWQTGMITYVFPAALFVFYLAHLVKLFFAQARSPSFAAVFFSSLLPLLSGGFSESFTSFQIAFLFLLVCTAFLSPPGSRGRRILPWALGGFFAALLAMGVIFASPGNEFRRAGLPDSPGVMATVRESFRLTHQFALQTLSKYSINSLLLLAWPAWITYSASSCGTTIRSVKSDWIAALLIVAFPAAMVGLIMACFAPPYYALSSPPPDRLLIINHLILSGMLVVMGALVGALLRSNFTPAPALTRSFILLVVILLGAALFLGPVQSARRIARQLPEMQQFSTDWDARQQVFLEARKNGHTVAVAPKVNNISGLDDVGPDPYNWWNQTIAGYYGLMSIRINE